MPQIPELGRSALYDTLRQGIKAYAPRWFRTIVRKATIPVAVAMKRHRWRQEICRFLPPEKEAEFRMLYEDARMRWDEGMHEPTGAPVEFPVGGFGHTVWLRPGTCDVILYYDVILHELYGMAAPKTANTIIDCGANIGLASAYFLVRYPASRVLALEPDPINFALCRRNLEQFGDRVQVIQKALWSSACPMRVSSDQAGTWASQVRPASEAGHDTMEGIDMVSLLKEHGLDCVDILKMDIEGAEIEVLSSDDLSWLASVRLFQIEPDSQRGRELFVSRLSAYGFSFASYGEIMIAYRESANENRIG